MRSHTTLPVVAVVVGDGAGMLEIAAPARVFDHDLPHAEVPGWDVHVVAGESGRLGTTAGIEMRPPNRYSALPDVLAEADTIIVPSWRPPGGDPPPRRLLDSLRSAHDRGATVAGLCLGAFVLADAGLLDGRRATTHWAAADALRHTHPSIDVDTDVLYIDDGTLLTSAGSAAGIDACLHLVRRDHGAAAANAIARSLVVAPHRNGGQGQFVERPVHTTTSDDLLSEAMEFAVNHLDDRTLSIDALASRAGMSRRTFDRRFRAHTGQSPLTWLTNQRVLHAQRLLERSDLGIDAIAHHSGFADGMTMRPHFRRIIGVSPHTYRHTFNGS